MNNPITFTPAASVTIRLAAGAVAQVFEMPPVDASNPDVKITNHAPHPIYLAFGEGARVDHEGVGTVTVKAGQSVLISASESVAALKVPLAEVNLPNGRYTPAAWRTTWSQAVADATKVSVLSHLSGGEIAITRGTATASVVF